MPYQITNLATLRARLQDKYEGVPFWADEEARLAINEGLRFWNVLTGFWKARVLVETTEGTVWYGVPTTLLCLIRADFNSTPMTQDSLEDIDLGRSNWEAETTADGGDVPNVLTLWMPAGTTLFAAWPADAIGANVIMLDGIALAPVLVNNFDVVDLGEEEINALLGYALHILTWKIGGEIFTNTLDLYKAFIAHAALRNGRLMASKAFRQLLNKATYRDSVPGLAKAVVP